MTGAHRGQTLSSKTRPPIDSDKFAAAVKACATDVRVTPASALSRVATCATR
jgi:hypothetical protein